MLGGNTSESTKASPAEATMRWQVAAKKNRPTQSCPLSYRDSWSCVCVWLRLSILIEIRDLQAIKPSWRKWLMKSGRASSTIRISLAKRLIIRPRGVTSMSYNHHIFRWDQKSKRPHCTRLMWCTPCQCLLVIWHYLTMIQCNRRLCRFLAAVMLNFAKKLARSVATKIDAMPHDSWEIGGDPKRRLFVGPYVAWCPKRNQNIRSHPTRLACGEYHSKRLVVAHEIVIDSWFCVVKRWWVAASDGDGDGDGGYIDEMNYVLRA